MREQSLVLDEKVVQAVKRKIGTGQNNTSYEVGGMQVARLVAAGLEGTAVCTCLFGLPVLGQD